MRGLMRFESSLALLKLNLEWISKPRDWTHFSALFSVDKFSVDFCYFLTKLSATWNPGDLLGNGLHLLMRSQVVIPATGFFLKFLQFSLNF
jgi:hypothetical protein